MYRHVALKEKWHLVVGTTSDLKVQRIIYWILQHEGNLMTRQPSFFAVDLSLMPGRLGITMNRAVPLSVCGLLLRNIALKGKGSEG